MTRRPALLCAAALCVSLAGCAQAVLLGYLIGGPPSIEPDFDSATGLSLSAPDTVVAVVCYAPTKLKWDYETIDEEVAKTVTYRLGQNHIKVINPDYVRAWLDEHPDWERAEEVGEAFKCDYVIDMELHAFRLHEENSRELLRGSCEATVNVVQLSYDKAGEGAAEDATGDKRNGWEFLDGERIYSKDIQQIFPTQAPRSAYDESLESFKAEYLSRLSEAIGWLFYERYSGDKIPWAT